METDSVLVMDGTPTLGRIDYADSAVFRMLYASGDISGICGGPARRGKAGGVNPS